MSQRLRMPAVLADNPGLVPSTQHGDSQPSITPVSGTGMSSLTSTSIAHTDVLTNMQAKHTHKIKIYK